MYVALCTFMTNSKAYHLPTTANDSFFEASLLDFSHYTRPAEFMGVKVPEVLLSGHHAEIAAWRRENALQNTLNKRPDLLAQTGAKTRKRALAAAGAK